MALRDLCRVRTADHFARPLKDGPQCGPYKILQGVIAQGHLDIAVASNLTFRDED
jgi:hypothetical protein